MEEEASLACVLFCWKFLEEGVSGALFLIAEVEGARLVRLGGIDGWLKVKLRERFPLSILGV